MVDDQVPQFADLLKQLFLFQGLNEAELAHIVARFQPYSFTGDKEVFAQGDEDNMFFVIFKGRVKITQADRKGEHLLSVFGAGEYFGEEALLFNRPRSATVTTLEPTILLGMEQGSFYDLIRDFPNIRTFLTVTADSRHMAQREKFDWLGEDEVVHLVRRKHEVFLLTSLLLPLFVGLISIPILAYGVTDLDSFINPRLLLYVGIMGIFISIFWIVWNWVNWGNDFYIVTNQRVLWVEKVILLYQSRREAPLTQILSVNVKRTWFGRILGYGDVEVRTFTGGIRMRRSASPILFAAYVEGFKAHAGYLLKQAENEAIRRSLQERLGLPVDSDTLWPSLQPRWRRRSGNQPQPGSLRDFLNTLFVVRYEEENVVTYRKHWLLLLRKTWIPTLLILFLVGFVALQFEDYLAGSTSIFASFPMFLLYAMIFLVLLGWWTYGYLDWSNDIYQLAPDQIRDIERKPLGDELKKTAPLESILSLEHHRDGIIQLLFNYGNVVINVGETRFIFRGVYNPDQVHQDVSDYIEALSRRKREIEAAREREQMLNWLLAYKSQIELYELIQTEKDWDIFPG